MVALAVVVRVEGELSETRLGGDRADDGADVGAGIAQVVDVGFGVAVGVRQAVAPAGL